MKLTFFTFLGFVATSNGQTDNPSAQPTTSVTETVSDSPSAQPTTSVAETVSDSPSAQPSTSVTDSPSAETTFETTEKCTTYCEQDAITNFCGGAVTDSYCELSGSYGAYDNCEKLRCVCECPDMSVYYPIEYDSGDRRGGDVKKLCGRNPDCERKDEICFSPIASTTVYGKGRVMMKDLMNGDDVLTMDGSYQTMYSMNHFHKSKVTTFVQIKTNLELEQPLELSPNHLIYVKDNKNPISASSVKLGDKLLTVEGEKEVLEINMITRDGLYNPLTMDGTIIVDGVAASVYTTPTGKTHVDISGVWSTIMESVSFHDALHMMAAPYRQICTAVSLDLCNLHRKKSAASTFAESFYFSFWLNQNDFVKFIIASLYVLLFGTLVNLTSLKVCILLANTCVFSKMTKVKKASA